MTENTSDQLSEKGKVFKSWCERYADQARALCERIKAEREQLSDAEILELYDQMQVFVEDSYSLAGLYQSVHPDEGVRLAGELAEQQLVKLITEFSLDRDLFEVFESLDTTKGDWQQDALRLIEKVLRDFRRAGVDRDEATRASIRDLNDKVTLVGQTFERNIREDTRYVEFADVGRLSGLPQDFIDAHQPDENGVIRISTDTTDFIPVMTYADDGALREELYRLRLKLAYPANENVLVELLSLRHELATTLGYTGWSHYATEELMIKHPERAREFIERVSDRSLARGRDELATLLKRKQKDDPQASKVYAWEKDYLMRQVLMEQYQFDSQQVRPYFNVANVFQGILEICENLFGLRFEQVKGADVWHPSVHVLDVFEKEERIGRIYLDLHPRENKYKHAAMFPMVGGLANRRIAEGAIVANFPDPAKTAGPALLEHQQVTTFFHEFGHLLHHILAGRQNWLRFSGVATEWDFVEVPSQLFEEWAWDAEMLQRFAVNEKGEAIPTELVERMREANEFGKGQQARQQMFYAALALGLYTIEPEKLELRSFVDDTQRRYSLYPVTEDAHFETGFGHLVGYSSNYYTYMWSLVIAKDFYDAFKQAGLADTKMTFAYRRAILEPGGSRDASELIKDFLGRDFNFDAFEKWLG